MPVRIFHLSKLIYPWQERMGRSAVLGFTGETSGIGILNNSSGCVGVFGVLFVVEFYVGNLSHVDWICMAAGILVATHRVFLSLFHVKHI